MTITKKFLNQCGKDGKYNYKQLRIFGVSYPPMEGWEFKVIGKQISDEQARELMFCRGLSKEQCIEREQKQRRIAKLEKLEKETLVYDIETEIRNAIRDKAINIRGLTFLDSLLDKIYCQIEITEDEIKKFKQSEVIYRDKENIAIKNSYVYVAGERNPLYNKGLLKIGYSTNPKSRIAGMRTANPTISLLAYEHGSLALEKRLHESLEQYRVSGEWFDLPTSVKGIKGYFRGAVNKVNKQNDKLINYRFTLLKKWNIKQFITQHLKVF